MLCKTCEGVGKISAEEICNACDGSGEICDKCRTAVNHCICGEN